MQKWGGKGARSPGRGAPPALLTLGAAGNSPAWIRSAASPCPALPLSPHAGVGEEAGGERQRVVGEDGVV